MIRFFSILCLVMGWVALFGYDVHALTVAPAVTEIELDPGTSIEREVTVFNETSQPITVSAQIESFVPRGEQGAAQTVNDGNQSLRWVQLGQNALTIAPGTTQTVPVLITVPKTASVGGYYMAILWQQSAVGESNVNLNGRVGALLLLTVKGEVKRSLSISDFSVDSASLRDPLRATVSIHNNGNIHLKPHGLLIVKNIFNRVVATVPINSEGGNVLPQSVRKFELAWPAQSISFIDVIKRLGMIKVSMYAEVDYEGGATLVSEQKDIWMIGPFLLSGGLIFLLVVALSIGVIMKKNKKLQA